jgi:5-methylcytosine-specific restriction endonuclease McrA
MLCLMSEAEPRGHLLVKGNPLSDDMLARQVSMDKSEVKEALVELESFGVFSRTDDGVIYSRKMARDSASEEKKLERAMAGARTKWGHQDGAEVGRSLRSQRLAASRQLGRHQAGQWQALKAFCKNSCVRCGKGEPDVEIVKDHILPIYQGGSDGIENIQPLCRRCNASKGPEGVDYRPSGWENACLMPAKMPAECLPQILEARSHNNLIVGSPPAAAQRQPKPKGYPPEFEAAWKAYPHIKGRSSKPDTLKAFLKLTDTHRGALAGAAAKYADEGREPKMDCGAPAMQRWLQSQRFEDWISEETPTSSAEAAQALKERREDEYRRTGYWNEDRWGPRPTKPNGGHQ